MRKSWLDRILLILLIVVVVFSVIMFAVGWAGIWVSRADGPEFTVWGSVTYESAQGPPVEGAVVRCHRVVSGGHYDTYPLAVDGRGQYKFEFGGAAEQLRIYVELLPGLKVIGNSTCWLCGLWGGVETVSCDIPPGQATYSRGPIRFFVGFLPTPTQTSTPTITNTPTRTSTPTATYTPTNTPTITPTPTRTLSPAPTLPPTQTPVPTLTPTYTLTSVPTITPTKTLLPTETPYLLPTAAPTPRATCATLLECQQQHEATGRELVAWIRYIAVLVTAMAAALGVDIGRKK